MKDKSFTQSAGEREAAFECLAVGLSSEFLNGSPERRLAMGRKSDSSSAGTAIRLRLSYRPPLCFDELLAFFHDRVLSGMVVSGDLRFDALADPIEQMGRLLHVKGIGPWTANYIGMRAYSHPDAFLEKDSGVAHALPEMTPKERIESVEPCRPWRSYAVICLWNSLGEQAPKPKGAQSS